MRRRAERDDREARRARTADVLQDVVRGGRQERRVARAGELCTHDRGVDQDAERVAVRGLRLGERRIGHSARHRHLARLAQHRRALRALGVRRLLHAERDVGMREERVPNIRAVRRVEDRAGIRACEALGYKLKHALYIRACLSP